MKKSVVHSRTFPSCREAVAVRQNEPTGGDREPRQLQVLPRKLAQVLAIGWRREVLVAPGEGCAPRPPRAAYSPFRPVVSLPTHRHRQQIVVGHLHHRMTVAADDRACGPAGRFSTRRGRSPTSCESRRSTARSSLKTSARRRLGSPEEVGGVSALAERGISPRARSGGSRCSHRMLVHQNPSSETRCTGRSSVEVPGPSGMSLGDPAHLVDQARMSGKFFDRASGVIGLEDRPLTFSSPRDRRQAFGRNVGDHDRSNRHERRRVSRDLAQGSAGSRREEGEERRRRH